MSLITLIPMSVITQSFITRHTALLMHLWGALRSVHPCSPYSSYPPEPVHPQTPYTSYPTHPNYLCQSTNILRTPHQVLVPAHAFNWVNIHTSGRCWPPVDALFLVDIFGNSAGVLWIILLHKAILSATKVILYEGLLFQLCTTHCNADKN